MKEEPNHSPIDPELEARIVAFVLGEASDFERDELNRLIKERPELAALEKEIQCVHGLLRDVATGEPVSEDDDWKLPADMRNAVLAVISPEANQQPGPQVVSKSAGQRRSKRMSFLGNIAKIAAVLCVAGFFGSMAMPSWRLSKSTPSSAFSIDRHDYDMAVSSGIDIGAERWFAEGEDSAPSSKLFMADSSGSMEFDEELLRAAETTVTPKSDGGNQSKSALLAIRESLRADVERPTAHDFVDDLQSLPAQSELSPPQDAFTTLESRAVENQTSTPQRGVNGPGPGLSRPAIEDLAQIPQGLERGGGQASKDALGWQDAPSFFSGIADQTSNGSGGDGDALKRGSIGLKEQHVVDAQPESPPQLTMPALGSPQSGQGEQLSRGLQSQAGGINDRSYVDQLGDLRVAGKEMDAISPDGESLFGEQLRPDENAPFGAFGNDVSPQRMPEDEIVQWGLDGKWRKTAPTKPMVAGSGGQEGEDKKTLDFGDLDAVTAAPGTSDPTRNPMSSTEAFKKKEVAKNFQEEFARESLSLASPREEDIALHEGRTVDAGESNGRQTPLAVAGTAKGLSDGEPQVRQRYQDQGWYYDVQPTIPHSGTTGLSVRGDDGLSDQNSEAAETYFERIAPKQKGVRAETRLGRDQMAANEPNVRYRFVPPTFMFDDHSELKTRAPIRKSVVPAGLGEKTAQDEAFSTFSLHVSDVSFKLARAALASGTWPEAAKIRIEEFVNAFDYGDPMPSQDEKVACRVEQSIHPFLQQRNLLRVSMRTAAAGRASDTPLRLTFLLDNSGSMERIDRQQTVRRAFSLLAQQLKPIDQVTLISFARQPRLLADKVSGAQSRQLVQLIENLPSEGGTNIEAALQLAFEKAREQQVDNAQNRIILLTDGAVNLGDANPESLSRMITTMRGEGIAFDAAGISAEGLNDAVLEALTRKGDGRYYLLDSLEAADDGFARQIAGALRPSAKNVKVQIEFNPKRVGRYKLLGFEKHRLKQEDFRNDKVDAAEMAAAEAGVAVYQFEAKQDGEGDVGSVSVRFRDLSTQQMVQRRWPIPYEPDAPRLNQAASSLRIATSAALLAATLRGEALGETVDLKTLSNLIDSLPDQDRDTNRVRQLQEMISQARQVSGK